MLLRLLAGGLATAILAGLAGCSASPVPDPPDRTSPLTSVAPPPWATSSDPTGTTGTTSTALPADPLPEDLVPNVVQNECLLTAAEFGGLIGRIVQRAENTELADGTGRRSCIYADQDDQPTGRVDVYAPASAPAGQLVSRIASNSERSQRIDNIGEGAVVLSGLDGTTELVVASRTLLVILTVLPGTAIPPSDAAWSVAAAAMFDQLPT